ncbi:hypothetical protein BLOT_000520 [Blomia tropicalis]|nr:hypothetical protein BLOT_000520 [Blomia tropicalis]
MKSFQCKSTIAKGNGNVTTESDTSTTTTTMSTINSFRSNDSVVQVQVQTSKRKMWNEFMVEEIEEEVTDDDDDDDIDEQQRPVSQINLSDNELSEQLNNLDENLVVIGDHAFLCDDQFSPKTMGKMGETFTFAEKPAISKSHDVTTTTTTTTTTGSTAQQLHQQQHQQRVQLKRKSYSASMSANVMQRTISSSSSNSHFGTVDEELTDDDDTTTTAKMNSSIDSVVDDANVFHQVEETRQQEEHQDFRVQKRSTNRAYARSISFSGVRSYHGTRYSQQQANLIRRGLIFHRLDGRTLLPSISCE